MGVRYVNVYFAALARRDLTLGVDFRNLDQPSEVSEVRWMDINDIRLVDNPSRRLEKTIAPVFRYVRRAVRGRGGPPPFLSLDSFPSKQGKRKRHYKKKKTRQHLQTD